MGSVINTNIMSINAQRNLGKSQGALAQSLERLSSGLRINSARDDAAGLAISERFTAQINGLNQAVRNSNDGISFAQTAEGALEEVSNLMQRVRELAVQSANDTNSASDRRALNQEVEQAVAEMNRIAASTQFNDQNVLDGSLEELIFQVGANRGQTITVQGVDSRTSQLGAEIGEGDAVLESAVGANFATLADDLTINGIAIDLDGAESMSDVVAAINNVFGDTNVQASRADSVEQALAFTAPGGTDGNTLELNGVQIAVSAGDDIADVTAAINAVSSQTGVTATEDGTNITFSSDADISFAITGSGDLAFGGETEDTIFRGIELSTDIGDTITTAGGDATLLGIAAFDGSGTNTETFSVAGTSVLTRDEANDAIRTMDFALQQVSGLRSELGAIQNRFEATISNLSVGSENLQAARSRIQDADFAQETAALTRAQILQQAGTSILSQANAVPQTVLGLLQ
ncbi:flagellin N-terminal helical domain-containing protein [Natronospira bacteriovora]|uniref:Flagellin n=1 Tax=Natronospira bacteriovora TaxID=3069753 RepID=A0ABU0W398_9GAMM|nr:flagellin [Natronospira sp. AB-CW4]MDQ2068484.1 flagellin [Natronospira sp. AB-CW4]